MRNSNSVDTIEKLIQRVQKTQHGFLDIQKAADKVFTGNTLDESFRLAKQLFVSEIYQARSLAVFILGRLASNSNESLLLLKMRVSKDDDWEDSPTEGLNGTSESSYGFRTERNADQVVRAVRGFIRSGHSWVVVWTSRNSLLGGPFYRFQADFPKQISVTLFQRVDCDFTC